MATIQCVTVLTPHGRRQSVKVTPNSTILQILEEVCTKHNFDPLEYDLRHHISILDTTMTVQFSRLPNNAQLEMVKAKKIRRESEVLVNVQIESGNRLSGTFLPLESLWDVVTKLCSDICVENKQPAVLYMRQEICGIENLKATTLRSLGLTSGRALLRFTCKTVETEVPEQSDVRSKLANNSVSNRNQPIVTVSGDSQNADNIQQFSNKEQDLKDEVKTEPESVKSTPEPSTVGRTLEEHSVAKGKKPCTRVSGEKDVSNQEPDNHCAVQHAPTQGEVSVNKEQQIGYTQLPVHSDAERKEVDLTSQEQVERDTSLEDIFKAEIQPRDRNAVVFKHGLHQPSSSEDLPDEFYELTLNDVQTLYRELRTKSSEIDEAPLHTSAIRKLEESQRILNNLHKYKRAVLRIQFPDQIIVQGSFSPVETIASVQEFVRGYLQDPSVSFHLFTTPPKVILEPSARLIEVNCVPCALLHFGVSGTQENFNYLRPEVLSELSSIEAASAAVILSRSLSATSETYPVPSTSGMQQSRPSTSGVQESRPSTSGVQAPKESKESAPSSTKTDTMRAGNPNGKVPKWFKIGPK